MSAGASTHTVLSLEAEPLAVDINRHAVGMDRHDAANRVARFARGDGEFERGRVVERRIGRIGFSVAFGVGFRFAASLRSAGGFAF